MATQTVTPCAGTICGYRMQLDHVWSPRSLRIHISPSQYCTQNGDSSEKTTFCHSCVHLCHLAHQSRRLSLCCIVKGSRSHDRLVDSPCCCKRRRTVRADAGRVDPACLSNPLIPYSHDSGGFRPLRWAISRYNNSHSR
ncbi:hypothetical protein HNY73_000725 [Argiope bruennichi]|uniref:Uncharacterized protein n=1 Tax=Argiope bruennichi TaxID=94029 RepID=A0A8T0FZ76_ARGBR|nr:hypothetical protein HNY73_000725 [Argiope bruennichi]